MEHHPTGPEVVETATFDFVEQLDEAHRKLGWQKQYRQLRSGGLNARFSARELNGATVARERFDAPLHIMAGMGRGLVGFSFPVIHGRSTAFDHELTDGDLIFFPASSELEFVTSDHAGGDILTISEEEFFATAAAVEPLRAELATLTAGVVHGGPQTLNRLRTELVSLRDGPGLNPVRLSNFLADLLAWIAEATRTGDEHSAALDSGAGRVARRAQQFIEDHYKNQIRMADLCQEIGVGLRTLQRCFAEYFSISPTDYIKSRRLHTARGLLVRARRGDGSVTEIALACGFTHLGRFSVDYKQHFGESPKETLHRPLVRTTDRT